MMNNRMRIAILAPVGTDKYNQRLFDAVKPVIPPDVDVEVRNLPEGHDCIEYRVDWLQNGYPVVLLAKKLEKEGFDGIWLSDFDMCGVEAAREVIDIPIIGGFTCSAFTALALSSRLSIVTILESTLAMQRNHMQEYGLEDSFASIRAIDCPVDQLDNIDVVVGKAFQAAMLAVNEDGAQSILLGCTGFVGVAARVSALLEDALQMYVPVIDPNQAGFSTLVSLVRMRLSQSRACYSKDKSV
jgi:Asp/Glu/hydantoin racemase